MSGRAAWVQPLAEALCGALEQVEAVLQHQGCGAWKALLITWNPHDVTQCCALAPNDLPRAHLLDAAAQALRATVIVGSVQVQRPPVDVLP